LRLYWCPERSAAGSRRTRVDRLLRNALAPLVGLPADALAFGRESKGRPFLRHDGAPDFNLSDTVGGTLIALTNTGRIGVDLERIDRRPPVHRLAARYFSREESSDLLRMSEEAARIAFLQLWTAKEASCKATGTGIYGFLADWRFDASTSTPSLQAAPADAGVRERWRFLRLSPSDQHTAVIALRDAAELSVSAYRLLD
jgi:4'-phosphopantetheinyl transferase